MNKLKLSVLITNAKDKLYELEFSESTVERSYGYIWNRMLLDVGDINNVNESEIIKHFISYYGYNLFDSSLFLSKNKIRIRNCFTELLFFMKHHTFNNLPIHKTIRTLSSFSSEMLEVYIEYQTTLPLKKVTIIKKKATIKRFLYQYPLENLNTTQLLLYFDSFKNHNKYASRLEMNKVKHFLEYLYVNNYIDTDYRSLFPKHPISSKNSISSSYTVEEILMLIESVRTLTSKTNKRNYAILLLLVIYGFRANDVIHLTFENINWDTNQISFNTSKTNVYIKFSLLSVVGNAIIDYLLNERPKTKDTHIFLDIHGNHIESSDTITQFVDSAFKNASIDIKNKHHGAHSLRASLATRMLANNTSIFTISKVLGHASIDTTKIYTKVDIVHLALCNLEVPVYE